MAHLWTINWENEPKESEWITLIILTEQYILWIMCWANVLRWAVFRSDDPQFTANSLSANPSILGSDAWRFLGPWLVGVSSRRGRPLGIPHTCMMWWRPQPVTRSDMGLNLFQAFQILESPFATECQVIIQMHYGKQKSKRGSAVDDTLEVNLCMERASPLAGKLCDGWGHRLLDLSLPYHSIAWIPNSFTIFIEYYNQGTAKHVNPFRSHNENLRNNLYILHILYFIAGVSDRAKEQLGLSQ